MSAFFCGKLVLRTERGQCERCKRQVIRVLVAEDGWRKWYAADIGNYGYDPHECRSGGASPLKAAA